MYRDKVRILYLKPLDATGEETAVEAMLPDKQTILTL